MKFALANGQRIEAQPGLSVVCPGCGAPMLARCGDVRIRHWAHVGKRMCDSWWENETEWHRAWKGHFPTEWQEVIQHAQDGEKHIADVKTDQDWVLEFQHSLLTAEERRARNDFYSKLIWVVDGVRRKRDRTQFFKALEGKAPIQPNFPMWTVFNRDCTLLQEWSNSRVPVFFDFGKDVPLWCLLPGPRDGIAYVGPLPRQTFLDFHKTGAMQSGQDFTGLLNRLNEIVSMHVTYCQTRAQNEIIRQRQFDLARQASRFPGYPQQRLRRRL